MTQTLLNHAVTDPTYLEDVAVFEDALRRFRNGELPEDRWRPFRLVHGIYGQRQAGWQMVRIKLPAGVVNAEQIERSADLAQEFGRGVVHLTTRQDFQIHYVQLDRVPEFMRQLADAGMTTREACGNAVRNVAAEALAGVNPAEAFDVTPYANAVAEFLLRHPKTQGLPRKFKIAFSGSGAGRLRTRRHRRGRSDR